MEERHARQLAELAMLTRNDLLLAEAVKALLQVLDSRHRNLPLFQAPPATIYQAGQRDALGFALGNFPGTTREELNEELGVEIREVPAPSFRLVEPEPDTNEAGNSARKRNIRPGARRWTADLILDLWQAAWGDAWVQNRQILGSAAIRRLEQAGNRDKIRERKQLTLAAMDVVEVDTDMTTREAADWFWTFMREGLRGTDWKVEERRSHHEEHGYSTLEHRIIRRDAEDRP